MELLVNKLLSGVLKVRIISTTTVSAEKYTFFEVKKSPHWAAYYDM